jgi:hypothetical protein
MGNSVSGNDSSAPAEGGFSHFLDQYRFKIAGDDVLPCAATDRPPIVLETTLASGAEAMVMSAGVASAVMSAGVLNKASLNKNKNKNKNKGSALQSGSGTGSQASLIPAFELRRLHTSPSPHAFTAARKFTWEQLDIPLPPGPDVTRLETTVMLSLQARDRERSRRKDDIEREATLDVSDFTKPLGIDGISGFDQTEGLFQSILTACEYVGLIYKAKFNRTRPNQVEPRLRLMLPNPAHQAYPSNHSFQCHSIAFAFNAILPEHPATEELSRIARKVAENREWAGLHYPSDTNGGRALAQRFQPYLRDAFMANYLAAQREWI